jgi:hypothetical protein
MGGGEKMKLAFPKRPRIVLFARANHPSGWGGMYAYSPGHNQALGAHGYVVIGVRCNSDEQVEAVKDHMMKKGLRIPDHGRVSRIKGPVDWKAMEWYSGGPNNFDYLGTFEGDIIDDPPFWGSKGDNRFFSVYESVEVLAE